MDQHDDLMAAALEAVNAVEAHNESESATHSGDIFQGGTSQGNSFDDDFDLEISITSFDDILNDSMHSIDSDLPDFPEISVVDSPLDDIKIPEVKEEKAPEVKEESENKPSIVRPAPTVHVTSSTIRPKAASVKLIPADSSSASSAAAPAQPVAAAKADSTKPVASDAAADSAKTTGESSNKPAISETPAASTSKPVVKPKFTFPKAIFGSKPAAAPETTTATKTLIGMKSVATADSNVVPRPSFGVKPAISPDSSAPKPVFGTKLGAPADSGVIPRPIFGSKSIFAAKQVAPEPVVAPEPAEEPKPVVEETPEPVSESVVAPEPVVEEKLVVAPEPVATPELVASPEPVVEQAVTSASEPAQSTQSVVAPEPAVVNEVAVSQTPAVSADVVAAYEAQIAELKGKFEEVSHALEETYKRALELRDENEQLKAVQKQFNDRLIRVTADFDNYRKRVQRDQEQNKNQAEERIVLSFLPVMDNLARALIHARQSQDYQQLLQGVEMTGKMYLNTLVKNGCVPFDSMGVEFDPNYHDVLQRVVDPDKPHNTIVQEHLKGYIMHDKVIRPALVVVAQHEDETEGGNV